MIKSIAKSSGKGADPDDAFVLGCLEGLAERIGIRIRTERIPEEDVPVEGGLCRIEGEHIVIFNARTAPGERIRILARALNGFDLSGIYVLPAIRELIERFRV